MRPLAGVRVLEAASYVSGPAATLALADLGADVTKIEPPSGDPFRRFGIRHEGLSVPWMAVNANKVTLVLDLKVEADVRRLHEHLAGADVLLTNWRPAVARRLGLADEEVRGRYPRLVWVRISGYGQDGPSADLPAFDSIVQARSGLVANNGDQPTLLPGYVADKLTAQMAAQAVLAALVSRSTTGEGALVDVAMIDVLAYFDGPDLLAGHAFVDGPGYDMVGHLGAMRPVATADGWLLVCPVSGRQMGRTLQAIGRPDAGTGLRRLTGRDITEALMELLDGALPARTTAEWEGIFAAADVPASAVLSIEDHLADPQLAHNGTFRVADEGPAGRVRRVHHPAKFDGSRAETAELAPPPLPPVPPGN